MVDIKPMRLLVLTQKIDRDDPTLGFFHRWVEVFAEQFESVIVICLEKGRCELPSNVRVLSLGKEERPSRIQYVVRFYNYIWQERKKYDAVFVHMNQEYVLLGGLFWLLYRVPVFLWRNHVKGSWKTRLSVALSKKVFFTSKRSYTARFSNSLEMPAGIDTNHFSPSSFAKCIENSLLYVGRIDPIKRLEVIIDAIVLLEKEAIPIKLDIVGSPSSGQETYASTLRKRYQSLQERGVVSWLGNIAQQNLPEVYRSHSFTLNATPPGSFDKAMLEAMSCGSVVLVASTIKTRWMNFLPLGKALEPDQRFESDDSEDLANKLKILLSLSEERRKEIRKRGSDYIVLHHSLTAVVKRIREFLDLSVQRTI